MPPTELGRHRHLAYALWLPQTPPPWPGVVILHGAGSCKENHADFARAAASAGFAAVTFDQRGHGESEPPMSPEALGDVGLMARLLAERGAEAGRIGVRGSSMGGFFAIHAAAISPDLSAVVAICPAGERHLLYGLRRGRLEMRVQEEGGLAGWLEEHDLREAVGALGGKPLLLIHAEGDEAIPHSFSEELAERAAGPHKLIVLPGGHHRSVQHDPEIQGISLRWLQQALAGRDRDRGGEPAGG